MDYIKASKRLPDTEDWIPVKIDGKYDLGYYRSFIGDVFGTMNHGTIINKNRVEWLDESTPPEKTYSEEERTDYRSLLLNISMNAGLTKRWMYMIETLLAKYDK